jgi:thiamine kinase-like enzyme
MVDPAPGDAPVACHNDVCPENVVFRGGGAVALLDFDFAAPGRRVFDLASMARMCVPIDTDEHASRTGRGGLDPFIRLRLVADAYGLERHERTMLLDVLDEQIDRGGEFVRRHVDAGEEAFIRMWEEMGGQERFDLRRRWFGDNRSQFIAALQ